jgi:threonine dehydratase
MIPERFKLRLLEAVVHIELPSVEEVLAAQELHKSLGLETRVLSVDATLLGKTRKIALKMESELPFNSYKLRGVANAVHQYKRRYQVNPKRLHTISAGNMAQAVASVARDLGIEVTAVVPDSAPEIKIQAIISFGAKVIRRPMAEVWSMIENPEYLEDQLLIHPLTTPGILAGYGVIALEIMQLNEMPEAVLIPFGVGGLTLGIAGVLKKLSPKTKIICIETEAASTLSEAIKANEPVYVTKTKTIADAIGTPRVVPKVLELIKENSLIDGTIVVTESQVVQAIKDLYLNHNIIAEGAAAAGYAAAQVSAFERPLVVMTGRNIHERDFRSIIGAMA